VSHDWQFPINLTANGAWGHSRVEVSPIIAEACSEGCHICFNPILSAKLVESRTPKQTTVFAKVVVRRVLSGDEPNGRSTLVAAVLTKNRRLVSSLE
jgi:hypothetical protein